MLQRDPAEEALKSNNMNLDQAMSKFTNIFKCLCKVLIWSMFTKINMNALIYSQWTEINMIWINATLRWISVCVCRCPVGEEDGPGQAGNGHVWLQQQHEQACCVSALCALQRCLWPHYLSWQGKTWNSALQTSVRGNEICLKNTEMHINEC